MLNRARHVTLRRSFAFALLWLYAFAGIALAAKACPLGLGGCLAGSVVAASAADHHAHGGAHHEAPPCAMASSGAASPIGAAAFAASLVAIAAPVVAPLTLAAAPRPSGLRALGVAPVPCPSLLATTARLRL